MATICVHESVPPALLPSNARLINHFEVKCQVHKFWEELNIQSFLLLSAKPFMNSWQVPSSVVMSKLIVLYTFPVSHLKNKNSRLCCSTASNCWLCYILTSAHGRQETEQGKFWLPKLKLSQSQINGLQMGSFVLPSPCAPSPFFFILWSCGLILIHFRNGNSVN